MTAPLPRSLPARYYTDPGLYAQAVERIFRAGWNYVCHDSELPAPGDYRAFTLLGDDLFLIRGRDSALRCFFNVCQHRGHPLVEGSGNARLLVCPYHAWTYELTGALRAAPGARDIPGFDRAGICLASMPVESLLGFVFVNPDGQAPAMDSLFPGVKYAARGLCPDIETRRFAHAHSAEEFCNWLVAVENYNECYHCGHVHKAFAKGVIDPESYDIQPLGEARVLHHTSRAAAKGEAWYDTSGSDYGSFYLYPAFSLQIYPGGMVNSYHWRPLGPENTEVHRGWYSASGGVDDALADLIARDRDTTFAEDLALVRAVQRGLGSRGYRPGPLVISPACGINSEHSIAALQGWVREDLE